MLSPFVADDDQSTVSVQHNSLVPCPPTILTQETNTNEQEISTSLTNVSQNTYSIPESFQSVRDMVNHWETCVVPNLILHKTKWKKHLKDKERKRLSRLKIIMKKIEDLVANGSDKIEVIQQLQDHYELHNKSISNLADVFVKNM